LDDDDACEIDYLQDYLRSISQWTTGVEYLRKAALFRCGPVYDPEETPTPTGTVFQPAGYRREDGVVPQIDPSALEWNRFGVYVDRLEKRIDALTHLAPHGKAHYYEQLRVLHPKDYGLMLARVRALEDIEVSSRDHVDQNPGGGEVFYQGPVVPYRPLTAYYSRGFAPTGSRGVGSGLITETSGLIW